MMIKVAVLCVCVVHLVSVSAGLFHRRTPHPEPERGGLSTSGARAPLSTEYLKQSRQRPLFARRGQYERQRLRVLYRVAPASPNDLPLPSKVDSRPAKPRCSHLTQSCMPKSGCCDPCTTCHCRFFKSICFCRRTKDMKPQRQK